MSIINQVYINNLADLEYSIRDGMVFNEEQKDTIIKICNQIIETLKEE